MNDFLQSLRNGNIKRQDRHRKHYDNPQYRNADRGGNRDKRNGPARKTFHNADLSDIKKALKVLNDNVELSRIAQERTAEAMERIAHSLQTLATGTPAAGGSAPNGSTASDASPSEPMPVSETTTGKSSPSQTVDDAQPQAATIISSLRDEGYTFDAIATHLNEKDIPTLSGRGKWRAQNVSRIFNTVG